MNFFESQARARNYTWLLVLLFSLAVIVLVALTNLVLMLAFGSLQGQQLPSGETFVRDVDWESFALIGAGVIIIVTAGSLYKIFALRAGGRIVAESMGGKLVQRNTKNLKQRQLLNVVEEMAIASGTPAPPVYLLADEHGINAFAAGFSPRDAVIGVTQGLIDHLDRDQLQGVIAHEFSHIFNGDMRLNIQLVGVLNGILVIGRVGYEIVRAPFRGSSRRVRYRSSNGKGGGVIGIIVITGLGLLIIGYTGIFFGNLIKAAVSRQREYLADASAVQYTRNPQGIAGALKRIGGLGTGSRIQNPAASDFSHALFANGISALLSSLWSTHPPLGERIRRIEPGWDGKYLVAPATHREASASSNKHASKATISGLAAVNQGIGQIGALSEGTINDARSLMTAIPVLLDESARNPWGARALVYGLLLDKDYSVRVKQLEHLQYHADRDVYQLMQKLVHDLNDLPARLRLPLIDLALPALKQLSNQQYQAFRDNVVKLVKLDERINLMEWSLQRILFNNLDTFFYNIPQPGVRYTRTRQLYYEILLVLTVLAHAGNKQQEQVGEAFSRAATRLEFSSAKPLEPSEISFKALERAVGKLQRLAPLLKENLVRACAVAVLADDRISTREIELLRAFADTLDCPMPLIKAQHD